MIHWVSLKDGVPFSWGITGSVDSVPEGAEVVESGIKFETMWRDDDGNWIARPVCPSPTVTQAGFEFGWVLSNHILSVYDVGSGLLIFTEQPVADAYGLSDAGQYRIEVECEGNFALPSTTFAAVASGRAPVSGMTNIAMPNAAMQAALSAAQTKAINEINAWAASQRQRYITTGAGQEMVYQAKQAEAVRWLTDPAPELADFPLLSAEIGVTAPDAYQLAQLWANMSALWLGAAAAIEGVRLRAGAAVTAAGTPEGVDASLRAFWAQL